MRATRTVVRPGRRAGGTTLIFRLSRPTDLRITIVRVYPSCKRIGSFTVHARAGVNRVHFRGLFRGRALPAGGYRLVVRARGAHRDAAAVPIVIARGRTSPSALRKARNGTTCSEPIADIGYASAPGELVGVQEDSGGGGSFDRVKDPVVEAAGAVAGTARRLAERVTAVGEDSPVDDPLVLTIVGLLLLLVATLATLLLAQIARAAGAREH